MKKLLSIALLLVLLTGVAAAPAVADQKITLNVWSFTDELKKMIDTYYTPTHPDVEINYQIYPSADFPGKLEPVLAANASDAPDVFCLEASFAKRFIESKYTASLYDLGFTEDEIKQDVAAMVDFGRDASGTPKGLAWQATPGALFYRASLAEKYLGITTPEAFQEKVSDWDTFIETAEEVRDASEGEVKMFSSIGDLMNPFLYQRKSAWIVDNKLVIDPAMPELMDLAKTCEEEGLYNQASQWAETWFAGMKTDITMCYFLPTWGLNYVLEANCGGTKPGEGTYGDWRMVTGPVGYAWGGTWVAANADRVAQMDDAKKAAVKEFIRCLTLDENAMYQYAMDTGDFVANIKATDRIVKNGGAPNDFLGGQDPYTVFAASAQLINASTKTGYDSDIEQLFQDNALTPYIKGEKDKDQAIADFKAQVKAAFADFQVD